MLYLLLFKGLGFENCSPCNNVMYYSKRIDCTNTLCEIVFFKQQHLDNKYIYFSVWNSLCLPIIICVAWFDLLITKLEFGFTRMYWHSIYECTLHLYCNKSFNIQYLKSILQDTDVSILLHMHVHLKAFRWSRKLNSSQPGRSIVFL